MRKTLNEIRTEGLEALKERLGAAGMIRFLQQFSNGAGDYAKERHAWADSVTLEDLRLQIPKKPSKRGRRRR